MRASSPHVAAFSLLALTNLLWAGNWVLGRALRDTFDPVSFNFWRWFIALVVLTPFGLRAVAGKGEILRRHAGILVLLALLSVPLFQTMVYQGLRTTTAINAVLLNSSAPVFMIACSWLLERERVTRRQVAGMLISLAGIVIIMTRGEPARLLELELHGGDAWILAAMPLWGLYSVLLKRRPAELSGVGLLFVIALLGVTMLAPFFLGHSMLAPPAAPTVDAVVALLYVGIGASVIAFICWNRAVWRWSARTRRGSPCTCCRHSARCSPSPSCMRNSAASMPRASLLSSPGCCSPPTGDSL
ncbi:MAG TPA: DMT family transporter [Burkholderiales bacterium]|nr:DMT family transporter [Burkholderiales bacterium]